MSEDQRPPDDPEPTRLDSEDLPGKPDETTRAGGGKPDDSSTAKRLGDFELLRELGRGGMGVVYEARQISLKRRVALKVLPPALGMTAQAKQRFEREAQAAAKLHHTNIVPVHAIGEHDGHHFYAMDLIDGQSLDLVLRDMVDAGSNPLMEATVTQTVTELRPQRAATSSQDQATTSLSDTSAGGREWFDTVAKLMAEVADGLHYAHGRGVIHRDVKPANLMLSREGHLSITDFGLARLLEEPGMTVSGSFLGTPAYMAPEQIAAGRINVDHRADIYSLGAVLYEMLTMQRPFGGQSREQVLAAVMTKDPRPPRRFNGKIPVDLETICLKALEKDVDRRYATAGELAQDLRQYLQGGLIAAKRAGIHRRTWKSIRRHPLAATVTAAFLTVGLITGFGWRALRQADVPHLVSEANLMLERGNHQAGLEAADRALALRPGLPEARILRARLLLQLARHDEVIADARALLDEHPDDWTAHFILAYVSKEGDRPGIPAAEHLAAVERLAPESADVYFLRGLLAKSASEAVELYTRALELNPAHTWALLRRGGRYLDLKNFDAAMVDAERMLAIRPRSPHGRRMFGWSYKDQLDFDRALAEFAKAIELDPEDPNTYLERGQVYDAMHRYDDSVADYTRAIEIGPPHALFYRWRANAYRQLGRDEEAIADARTALELNPDYIWASDILLGVYQKLDRMDEFERTADELRARTAGWADTEAQANAYRSLSVVYRRMGAHEQALVEADRAVEADPDHLWARIERINVLRALNDDAGFEAECDALAALELEDPEPLGDRADEGLGFACLRWEKDVELLDEVVEDYPEWHLLYFDRGIAYGFLSRYEEALSDLTRAIELNPLHGLAYGNRAVVYIFLQRYEEALADLDKALELDPRNALHLNNRGAVAMILGQTEEALRFHDRAIEVDPLYVWPRTNRASILALLGRCSEAMDELQAVEGLLDRTSKYTIVGAHTGALFWNCPDGYDPVKALAYARESAEALPGEIQIVAALGAALYRNGHYREAREALLKVQAMSSSAGARGELFYLAMSSWQLGEKQQARSYYDQGLAWMNEYSTKSPGLILLREEATRLLGIQP